MVHPTIRVIIADDHPIVRDGIAAILAPQPDLKVVAIAENFAKLAASLAQIEADILLLDIAGMGGSPLSLVERLRRERPDIAVIIFSSSVDLVPEMLRAGARGYVVKDDMSSQLTMAIRAVFEGQAYLSPAAEEYRSRSTGSGKRHRLTPQELTVLGLLAQHKDTLAIADHLTIDPRTVHNYISKLKQKTGCDDRLQLIDWYERLYGPRRSSV